jgi:hypothetical protein
MPSSYTPVAARATRSLVLPGGNERLQQAAARPRFPAGLPDHLRARRRNMTRSTRIAAAVMAVFALCSTPLAAQETPDSAVQAERMAKTMELMQPGEEHKLLEKMAGTWHMAITIWMEPGSDPLLQNGITKSRMILGGRFLLSEGTSGEGFMSGQNLGIMGFDRRFGHYTSVGYDTYGTYYVAATGTFDARTRTLTLSGEDYDPVMQHTQVYDFVTRFISDNEYTSAVIFKDEHHTKGGEPFKMVEITFTRAE